MICADKHGNIVPPPKHEDLTSTFAIVADGDGPERLKQILGLSRALIKTISTVQLRLRDSVLPPAARTHCSFSPPTTKRNGGNVVAKPNRQSEGRRLNSI